MAEIPPHLLERAAARRAALSGKAPDPAATPASGAPVPAAATPVPVAASVVGTPVPPPPAAPVPSAPAAPATPRSGVPPWMMPVLFLLPLWAITYMGAFGEKEVDSAALTPVQRGKIIYDQVAACGSCHGASGGGGVGPKLSGGEAELTFLTAEEQAAFIKAGSGPIKGQPYGDPNRPGGQRIAKSGGMPGFASQLTDAEIADVVAYEREGL
ncbi:MAG: c-type cytochrome [Acidimicrobiales bacterium]